MLLNSTDSKIHEPVLGSPEGTVTSITKAQLAATTINTSDVRKIQRQFEIKNIKAHFIKHIEATRTDAYLFELSEENLADIFKLTGNFAKILDMAIKTSGVSLIAPVPDTSQIAVIVPRKNAGIVRIEPFIEEIKSGNYRIPCILGEDYLGKPVILDLATCQHQLIGGATGSGKSNLIKAIITGVLLGCLPRDIKLLIIDGKGLDFCIFNAAKHLLRPVITEMEGAVAALQWLVQEMERRVDILKAAKTYDIWAYNKKVLAKKRKSNRILPALVVIVDEVQVFASNGVKAFEELIFKLTQKGRSIGIVMILATQRPSVDILQGSIKTNLSGRIALRLPTQTDSRVILDQNGAESLRNSGDLLTLQPSAENDMRLQAPYVADRDFTGSSNRHISISPQDKSGCSLTKVFTKIATKFKLIGSITGNYNS